EKIPVVLIDGELHAHWRLSADRLRQSLEEALV
ncbi:MAG: glutaredoxin family protein, partial [Microbacterium sp.]